jgi:predicted nucleotidyltransferase
MADGVTADELAAIAPRHPALDLLVLFGSRARGDARPDSDWDFAYLAGGSLDALALRADLADALGTDALDLVNLDRAGGLLRFRAARDGTALFERRPGLFARFQYEAASFWCQAGPVIQRAYERLLEDASR